MDKKFHLLSILMMILIVLVVPFYALGAGESGPSNQMLRMDELSEQLLSLTEQGKYVEAKAKLEDLSALYTQIGGEKKISIEALEIISESIIKAKRNYAAINPDKNAILWSAHQMRLMTDAITHPNQPIWKNFKEQYDEQVDKMISSADKGDTQSFRKQLQSNLNLYNLLKPCFSLAQTPQTMEMISSIYTFLGRQTGVELSTRDKQAIHHSLIQLREVTDNVFLGKEQHTLGYYMHSDSPLVMITIMSSILLSALTYVGWRMYHGARV